MMRLELCTWIEVEEYLERSRGIIVPVGSTEQHGPTGLLGTDHICAQAIARRVGDEAGALVAPTISVGMSVHHLAFAGSMTLRPSTLLLVARDYIQSLARHGFERFYFINGHGGNTATLRAAFSEVHAEADAGGGGREIRCRLTSWWETESLDAITPELFGDRSGSHASASEISIAQAVFPDHIKTAPLGPYSPKNEPFHWPADFRRRYPDGRIGSDPSLASPEKGERLLTVIVPELARQYGEFMDAD